MNHGIYSAVSGSLSAQKRIDAIASNLANASTPGFKAQLLLQRAASPATPVSSTTGVATPINRSQLQTDFGQGPLQRTGNPLDLALSGPGFFVVAGPEGERLTRRGSFAIDEAGFLVSSDGRRVQGSSGDLAITTSGSAPGSIQIGNDGTVQVGDSSVGKLRVVTVADPQALERQGDSLYASRGQAPSDAPPESVDVNQGALEGANVSPVECLVELIETMRGYEAYVNAASRLDDVMGRATTEIARD